MITSDKKIEPALNNYRQELIDIAELAVTETILIDQAWQQRYTKLLKLGKRIQEKPLLRTPENEIKGCEAKLWVSSTSENEQRFFSIDSDSRIIRGLAGLLLLQVNGSNQTEINHFDAEQFLQLNGFSKHISPSRNNGLKLLLHRLKTG